MAHRMATRPRITAVIAVNNAEEHVSRAIESLLSQGIRSLQIVVVDCASTDRTKSVCERISEHELSVDVMSCDTVNVLVGRDCGLTAARGHFVTFMDGDGWFGKQSLPALLDLAEQDDCSMVVSRHSWDTYDKAGNCSSRLSTAVEDGADGHGLAAALDQLIDGNALDSVCGNVYDTELLQSSFVGFAEARGDVSVNAAYLQHVDKVRLAEGAVYHCPEPESAVLDPQMFDAVRMAHDDLLQLAATRGGDRGADIVCSANRWFFRKLVSCIQSVCLSSRVVPSSEGKDRVRAMLESPDTRQVVESLKTRNRDLGIMYGAIAKRNVAACYVGSWISGVMHNAPHI